jgi:hypothetical protein
MPRTTKPRSNAERQAAYRRRHLRNPDADDDMLARLNLMLCVPAKCQLERLAACYGVTQRSVLERLLEEAEDRAVAALSGKALSDYYEKRPTPLSGHAPISTARAATPVDFASEPPADFKSEAAARTSGEPCARQERGSLLRADLGSRLDAG